MSAGWVECVRWTDHWFTIFRFDVFNPNINLVFSAYPNYDVAYWEPTTTYRMQYGDSLACFVIYSALANVAAGYYRALLVLLVLVGASPAYEWLLIIQKHLIAVTKVPRKSHRYEVAMFL
jgi:hypothetical protein